MQPRPAPLPSATCCCASGSARLLPPARRTCPTAACSPCTRTARSSPASRRAPALPRRGPPRGRGRSELVAACTCPHGADGRFCKHAAPTASPGRGARAARGRRGPRGGRAPAPRLAGTSLPRPRRRPASGSAARRPARARRRRAPAAAGGHRARPPQCRRWKRPASSRPGEDAVDVAISTLTPLRFLQRSEDAGPTARPSATPTGCGPTPRTASACAAPPRRCAPSWGSATATGSPRSCPTWPPRWSCTTPCRAPAPCWSRSTRGWPPTTTRTSSVTQRRARSSRTPPGARCSRPALDQLGGDAPTVVWDDGSYDALLAAAEPAELRPPRRRDRDALDQLHQRNDGRPKGVVYHHRGAYLQAVGHGIHAGLTPTRCTSGRCPCSTPTGGRSRGRSRRPAARHRCLLASTRGDVGRHSHRGRDAFLPLRPCC